MPKIVPVEVRIADLPQFRQLISSVATLLKTLAKCDDLPGPVMAAADQLRRDVAALGGRDIGPPPQPSDEDRIRDAMAGAQDHPGRVVTMACQGFRWVGQSLACCDECGRPAWEHKGEMRLRDGAAPFGSDGDWELRPWSPGEAEAIRRKWAR